MGGHRTSVLSLGEPGQPADIGEYQRIAQSVVQPARRPGMTPSRLVSALASRPAT
jgi:hypothetical protein